ncbi:hypothetical protein [Nocardia brasiliensis]|uniref:hypothetical protein n=1 Tax=Nocardia brasiliensis TaxID=37326 RepID=UPI0024565CAA|nr:hypothetical protein [Nocardia brasiliensis]
MIGVTAQSFSVASPTLLNAYTTIIADQLCLVVRRSERLKDYQPLYAPVVEYLDAHHHGKISVAEYRDMEMMARWCIHTTYAIFGRKTGTINHSTVRLSAPQ